MMWKFTNIMAAKYQKNLSSELPQNTQIIQTSRKKLIKKEKKAIGLRKKERDTKTCLQKKDVDLEV